MFNCNQDTVLLSQSMATDFESAPIDINGAWVWAIEFSWINNNSTSSIKLQGSISGIVWCDITDSSKIVELWTTNDHDFWDFGRPTGLKFVRIAFTAGSNTDGTMSAVINKKFDRSGDFPGR